MPQVLRRPEEIARAFNQSILLVDFQDKEDRGAFPINGKHDETARNKFIAWLKRNPNIYYELCFPPFSDNYLVMPYTGMLALILSPDLQPDEYQGTLEAWENEDGSPKEKHISLFIQEVPKEGDDETT